MRGSAPRFGKATHKQAGRRSPDNYMLKAGGCAPLFGDLAYGATAAGADAGADVHPAHLFAGGWRALRHEVVKSRAAHPTKSVQAVHG